MMAGNYLCHSRMWEHAMKVRFAAAVLFLLVPVLPGKGAELGPENLALQAKASASSEYSGQYLARFAIDGVVPDQNGRDDVGHAWCILGKEAGDKADFTLEWPTPVIVSELVYFGRTGWSTEECWKEYELYLNGDATPVAKGQFATLHGPQRIKFPKATVTRITLKFTKSFGGPNAGASEIMAFATSPPQSYFADFGGLEVEYPDWVPSVQKMLVILRHELNPSHVYTYHSEGFRPGGGLYEFTPGEDGGELKELVASPKGQILDCALSHDGREVLFSWKGGGREYNAQFDRSLPPDKSPEHMYRIYRMNVDGTGLTAITDGMSNNMNPCWLPDGDIAFLSDRKPAFAYCFVSTSPTLYRMDREGQNVKRLSANYLNDFTPHVTDDGRIIYSRWEYVDRPAIPIQGLWSMNPDGTALSAVFGNRVLTPATFMEARSIPGSDDLLCVLTSHNGPCRGAIGRIDRSIGPNAQEAIRNLTPDVQGGFGRRGRWEPYRGPYENPVPHRRRVLPGVEAGFYSRPQLRRHQAGGAFASRKMAWATTAPRRSYLESRAPNHSPASRRSSPTQAPGPRFACRTFTRGSSHTSSAARSSRFAWSRRLRRAGGHRRRLPTSGRKASRRSVFNSRWSLVEPPILLRKSGDLPR